MELIPVAGPSITQLEIDYVTDAVKTAWYGNANCYNNRFETAFAKYVSRKHAISLPSCTSALHLALLSLGVGPGDEVIVPECTWIATSAPISYVGATPVFADIDPATWCIDPSSVEALITPRTKAVIPVDLYGGMPSYDALLEITSRNNIAVIEDAAEAFGAQYKGRMAGAFGNVGTFSFHGSKTMTTGEGGMLVTDSDEIFDRCEFLRDHGRSPGGRMFFNTEVAYKYKMSAMQAALGLAQIERADYLIERKREIFRWYEEFLGDANSLTLNPEPPHTKNSYWMITIVVKDRIALTSDSLMAELLKRSIDTRPFFRPLSSLPAYADLPTAAAAQERNYESYKLGQCGVNLPSGLNLDKQTVRYVCDNVKDVLSRFC